MTQNGCVCACAVPAISAPATGLELKLGKGVSEDVGLEYSTNERWAGQRWLDRKKMYSVHGTMFHTCTDR